MLDVLIELSATAVSRVAAAAPGVAALYPGTRVQRTATVWQPGVVVTAEQGLPDQPEIPVVLPGGGAATAQLAGRDPGTNVAVLRVEIEGQHLPDSPDPKVGALALVLGAAKDGSPTARVAVIHRVGPAWHSAANGTIDRLIRLDARLTGRDEGGPVLDPRGALFGMATLGTRGRVLVIPVSTVERTVQQVLSGKRVAQGWLGLGLQPVDIPAALRESVGREAGLMVISLAANGPAEQAGVMPGDILIGVDGIATPHPRAVAHAISGDRVGQDVPLLLLRSGAPVTVSATIRERPAA